MASSKLLRVLFLKDATFTLFFMSRRPSTLSHENLLCCPQAPHNSIPLSNSPDTTEKAIYSLELSPPRRLLQSSNHVWQTGNSQVRQTSSADNKVRVCYNRFLFWDNFANRSLANSLADPMAQKRLLSSRGLPSPRRQTRNLQRQTRTKRITERKPMASMRIWI